MPQSTIIIQATLPKFNFTFENEGEKLDIRYFKLLENEDELRFLDSKLLKDNEHFFKCIIRHGTKCKYNENRKIYTLTQAKRIYKRSLDL